ncbi:MAG: TetR/AcrR family transcriptional regulator [Bacteroidota bacterium]
MLNHRQQAWIDAGYQLFAKQGPPGLKVEVLAREVGKSKSSFYHHFADLEVFTEFLLQYHLEQTALIYEKERACRKVVPELLYVLLEAKTDLLFNRQLRIHRHIPAFQRCFEKTSQEAATSIQDIWAAELGLAENTRLGVMVLQLTLENFYLQITPETLTYDWLVHYVTELKAMVQAFAQHEKRKDDWVK